MSLCGAEVQKRTRDLAAERARRAAKRAQEAEYLQALADGCTAVELMRIVSGKPASVGSSGLDLQCQVAPPARIGMQDSCGLQIFRECSRQDSCPDGLPV